MEIEIWSDVVCPWCYIGTRRLERALAGFAHRDEVEVVYRSFQLDPGAPAVADGTVVEMLAKKYAGGDVAAAREMIARTDSIAAEEGLEFRHADAPHVRTVDAHRLLHLALEESGPETQRALELELLAAYFTRAENVADPEVLRTAAAAVGLDAGRVEQVLAGDEYVDAVQRDGEEARALGATGVPFFVLDRRFGVSGGQPADLFRQALEEAWRTRPQPLKLPTVPGLGPDDIGTSGEICGPDGCAVPQR
jgi:predicted DsbA family dithiol-disulfide isomerase